MRDRPTSSSCSSSRVRRLAAAGRQPLDDDPADPAAGVVLEADDRVGDAAVARAVVDAADAVAACRRSLPLPQPPAARAPLLADAAAAVDRPLPAELDLLGAGRACSR